MVKTPSQDYDDSYCIQYARQTNAYIVTNDKFRDYIAKLEQKTTQVVCDTEAVKKEKTWIK